MATGKVTILGCGGSGGVPLITGHWGACNPNNPRNRRLRSAIAVQSGDVCLIVDTGPDFREQTLKFGIKKIDAILYTHAHSDHVNGVDELRYLKFVQQSMIKAYGDLGTLMELQSRFSHLFVASADGVYDPVITSVAFDSEHYGRAYDIAGIPTIPFWQQHGKAGHSLGYRFGNFAYSTDVSGLDDAAFEVLKGIDTWLVDCGQFGSEWVQIHPNLDVVKQWNERVGAKHVILTHMTPRVDYDAVVAACPGGFEPAYDGMVITIGA